MNRKPPIIEDHIEPGTDYRIGQQVDLIIGRETDLGWVATVNGQDLGLLYANEVFRPLREGEECVGYIKHLRDDGKIDLSLQQSGVRDRDEMADKIVYVLEGAGGFLALNDKSEADDIYSNFGMSKKKFKMALGGLLKSGTVKFEKDGIRLVVAPE